MNLKRAVVSNNSTKCSPVRTLNHMVKTLKNNSSHILDFLLCKVCDTLEFVLDVLQRRNLGLGLFEAEATGVV